MRTYHVFRATNPPELRGYTDDPAGERLPARYGPWTIIQQVGPDEEWTQDVSRAVVASGILDHDCAITSHSRGTCFRTAGRWKAITPTSRKSRSKMLRPSTVRAKPGLVP